MPNPFVTIVVTSYLEESRPYLDLCLESIKNLYYDQFEVIIVTPPWYKPQGHGFRVEHPTMENYNNAHALNFGTSLASPNAKYYLHLNDDVILTRHCLKNLVQASGLLEDRALLMPIGNDQQGRYFLGVHGGIGPYRIEQLKDTTGMMNVQSPFGFGVFFFDTLCLYACLVPRNLFSGVGPYDEARQGQTDIDYCLRVTRSGYWNGIVLNSLVYHAGGVSAELTHTPQSRAESLASFKQKWPEYRG